MSLRQIRTLHAGGVVSEVYYDLCGIFLRALGVSVDPLPTVAVCILYEQGDCIVIADRTSRAAPPERPANMSRSSPSSMIRPMQPRQLAPKSLQGNTGRAK